MKRVKGGSTAARRVLRFETRPLAPRIKIRVWKTKSTFADWVLQIDRSSGRAGLRARQINVCRARGLPYHLLMFLFFRPEDARPVRASQPVLQCGIPDAQHSSKTIRCEISFLAPD